MRNYKLWITALLACIAWNWTYAHVPDGVRPSGNKSNKVKYRDICAASTSQIDQEINNVRARLLGGGDCWWDLKDNGRYIVPKVDVSSGQPEVSSIFAGSVWLGGVDPGGNLKLACQDYRDGGDNDFWPGPLGDIGTTERAICANWNRHFVVTGNEIREHLANLAEGKTDKEDIPRGLRGWPAIGNQYFAEIWGFDLPNTPQGLAGFFDAEPKDGKYDPLQGDYPSIEIRGCLLDRYPDEMIFWIYNDQGGGAEHAVTNGSPIQMEVQVQSFGYVTTDELNDMTFQRYKLINRAVERIDSTFFAMWVDPDLGCYVDDYIGCDTAKELMYVYNQDATDGQPNCNCDQGVPTYCDKVPILGVDYFRGPLDTFGNEIGMSSFVYYNNPSVGNPLPGTTDPADDYEFYNYLTGTWRDGSPFQYGGSGYQSGGATIRYAFTDAPNDPAGWSMCSAGLPYSDRRTLQASGPFTLKPGAKNELIIGIPWVPDISYPCPDLENLFRADKLAQGLFDNCFELLDGPDAPTVDWIEMNQQIIAVLTNERPSNDTFELYRQQDFLAPDSLKFSTDSAVLESTYYKFEGYKIYQLADPNVSNAEFETNPDKSRLVYQVDLKNNVGTVYNWFESFDPNSGNKIYFPELKVQGENKGIRHTFSITDDKFALGNDKRLINHKKYYFAVIAYAYNNWGVFDPLTSPAPGQQRSYLPGRRGPKGGQVEIITVIPRPVVDKSLQAAYGDGVVVTRLEGAGAGGNFLDLDSVSRAELWTPGLEDTILTYKTGRGPVSVTIFNPFEVKDGLYELRLVDGNLTDKTLDPDTRWQLRQLPNGNVIVSDRTIADVNEQILLDYGFSVTVAQTAEPGDNADERNGGIGAEIEYADRNQQWLQGYPDGQLGLFNYVKTNKLEADDDLDPNQGLSTLGDGWFVPYTLCDWRTNPDQRMITPAWTEKGGAAEGQLSGSANGSETVRRERLTKLPNVDIVLTKDKSKWSRCIVVESASYYYTGAEYPKDPTLLTESPPNKVRQMFDVRYSLSVGKDGKADGALNPTTAPANQGIPAAYQGQPVYGMGWFPGYAVDVETGQRLNIFFGENSCYDDALNPNYTGRDMLWNPTDQQIREDNGNLPGDYYDFVLGGQHWVYVMYTPYDECEAARKRFTPEFNGNPAVAKITQVRNIAWAGMIQMGTGYRMNSIDEGLIPNDAVIKLRVDNPYQTWYQDDNSGQKTGHPVYQIKIENRQALDLQGIQIANALDSVKVVPNPYYGFSQYETSQFTNTVKITNLPGICTVTIYSLDGKFIRQYQRNEVYQSYQQISPALEWDMKNSKGIPVASGVYLIQVQAPGMGERTLKWFGIGRQFDPSGL